MKDHQFKHTNDQRRASLVYSQGKPALYSPQDFFIKRIIDVDNEGDEEEQVETRPLLQEDPYFYTEESSNRRSRELLSEERNLLQNNNLITEDSNSDIIPSTWETAVKNGLLKTSHHLEINALTKSALPLVITFLLQNSLSLASIFSVGHIGKAELAGITLGSMTANITGFAAIQGLTTCLDTLCSQAFGAGKFELVGLQFIRCAIFAITCFIPISIIWVWFSTNLLSLMVKDYELVLIAAKYLQIVSIGMPGFILFECGKRFLQCQGVFHASTYVLLVCAPLNALLNWVLVWKFELGYIGAPIAITINYWLMPLGLLCYTIYDQKVLKCWPQNFQINQAFTNWSKMIHLALPGVVMVEAEFLGFEIVTLMASRLGTTELASQSVVCSIAALAYQVPFSVSIATATRVANYIGASLVVNAKKCCTASMNLGLIIGIINSLIILKFRYQITSFFTNDEEVISKVAGVLPLLSIMEIIDCLNACSAGCLRGQGVQKIGSYINIFSFYVVGLPISYIMTFKYDMNIAGLWIGIISGLISMCLLQFYIVFIGADWDKIVVDARKRNEE
ncbi:hypothetical protein WICANDRAFT_81884 [Wickerhamomyces anomalus NRRL Y-366-8]|uniref:Uncharacterized protein n=1 Tax=Wickerhamomyces anomalus (strain ATCC 58044 / CBS 1984 / NCYC 433 / NRRL Y-366-8) TaxID=683960 RepID=A0A1E3P893_WICAA|nr:uncharacterized protein WICANDRAFT_81884 [Wickerhamomyces anomalus NRRL Y-366-8]ODQ61629.1 hypothetical protein WICANDRAFT_81884 [Wickerhamomyces anomalus NRRL Y-366-8]